MRCPAGTPQPGCLLCGGELNPDTEPIEVPATAELVSWADQWNIPPKAIRPLIEPYRPNWFVRIWNRRGHKLPCG